MIDHTRRNVLATGAAATAMAAAPQVFAQQAGQGHTKLISRGVDYIEGKEIDAEHAALVPPDCIGGLLSHAPTEPTDGAIKRLRPTSVFAGVTGDRAPWSAIISSR